ncbi:MAG: hypothetical protein KA712_08535 [Myxococcales bacterium]|nr:hypothetical protein [Myxococcales bacterium]
MRPSFLLRWAGVTLAGIVLMLPAPARAKPGVKVGQGPHRYEWVEGWPKLPPGMNVGQTHGDVVIDSKDRVFFSVDTGNALFMADPEGRILRVFGQDLAAGIHGMRLVKEANGREVIWLAHLGRHEVIKISLTGETLLTIPFPDRRGIYRTAEEYRPTAVDVAPNGDVYVVDGYGRYWLHRFDNEGNYVQSWNGSEGQAGPFREPHGVGIDLRGATPQVVVADRANHRLQRFALDGTYLGQVEEGLRRPSKIVARGRDLLVVDLEGRVTLFDESYRVTAHLGDNSNPELRGKYAVPPAEWRPGEFNAPHGAAWDSQGNLYVAEWNAYGRINKLLRKPAEPAAPR